MSRTAGIVAGRQLGVISRKDSAKKPRKLLQTVVALFVSLYTFKHVKLDFQLLSNLLTKNCSDLISITLVVFQKKSYIYLNDYSVKMITMFDFIYNIFDKCMCTGT